MAEKGDNTEKKEKQLVHLEKDVFDKWEQISNEEIIEKTNWIILEYESDHNLVLKSSGPKGILEGRKQVKDNVLCFLIVRGCHASGLNVVHIDIIIQWLPPRISQFDRAKSTFHVDHIVSQLSLGHFFIIEINDRSQLECEFLERRIRKSTNHTGGQFAFDGKTVKLRRKRQQSIIARNKREEIANLTKEHDKQREINVFQEIYDTEEAYVNQMSEFYNLYVLPMKDVNPLFYGMLVSNVKLILDINRPFLANMQECSFRTSPEEDRFIEEEEGEKSSLGESNKVIDDSQKIKNVAKLVNLLVQFCPVFKLYLPYINVYTKLVTKAKDLMLEDEKFEKFCRTTKQKLEMKESRNTDIYGFLIMPIQRIPRYQLLMRELHRKTEPGDPNYASIEDGLNRVGEIARYIDAKKAENEMSQKTIELSQKYKMMDLVDIHRKMKKMSRCKYLGKPANLYVFNDLLLLCDFHPKKFVRVNLTNPDVRCYPSEKEDIVFILETERKRHQIEMKRRQLRDGMVEYIQTILVVSSSQTTMSNKFQDRSIFQSYLQKEGGGTFSYNIKKRWHVLTTDYKMKYYDSPDGKFKGSYSLFNCCIGKGKDTTKRKRAGLAGLMQSTKDLKAVSVSVKKECWFYIETKKRTYFLLAQDVIVLDTWVRVLELIGCERKDCLEWEEEKWQKMEMERLKSRVVMGASQKLDDSDFDLPDMFSSSSSQQQQLKSFIKKEGQGEDEDNDDRKGSLIKVNIDSKSLKVSFSENTNLDDDNDNNNNQSKEPLKQQKEKKEMEKSNIITDVQQQEEEKVPKEKEEEEVGESQKKSEIESSIIQEEKEKVEGEEEEESIQLMEEAIKKVYTEVFE